MPASIKDELVVNLLKAVFPKDETETKSMSLYNICRYVDEFIKLYTIYNDGVGSWYEEKLEELLHNNGYKEKSKENFFLCAKYITFEELKNLLGENIKKSLSKSNFSNYNAFDLLAWYRSNNTALGDYEKYFPYVLYTDENVDRTLSRILKFKINDFSVIHYEDYGDEILVHSVYVDTKMRRQGYGYQMLEGFLKLVKVEGKKWVIIESTSDGMRRMLKKIIKTGFLKKSRKLYCGKNTVYNIPIPKQAT